MTRFGERVIVVDGEKTKLRQLEFRKISVGGVLQTKLHHVA